MQEDSLKYLKSICRKFAEKHEVFDIVLYGSVVRRSGDARDLDLLLIFENRSLKERTEISQNLKEAVTKKTKGVDIKTINLKEFFDAVFLARQGILVEGYSLLDDIPFCEKFGFKGYNLFTYDLKNMDHTMKTRFTYALIGRNRPGMIKKINAQPIGKAVVLVSVENSLIFESFLRKWNVNFKRRGILLSSV